jgi:hypothetical protein
MPVSTTSTPSSPMIAIELPLARADFGSGAMNAQMPSRDLDRFVGRGDVGRVLRHRRDRAGEDRDARDEESSHPVIIRVLRAPRCHTFASRLPS